MLQELCRWYHSILHRQRNQEVIADLEKVSKIFLKWFQNNNIKPNPDKYHLLVNNRMNKGSFISRWNECYLRVYLKTLLTKQTKDVWANLMISFTSSVSL